MVVVLVQLKFHVEYLYHEYEYDRQGNIVTANCIIPTGQNLANIDDDMKKLVPEIIDKPKEEIVKHLEMLVRAYDPCISCSVHMLNVGFHKRRLKYSLKEIPLDKKTKFKIIAVGNDLYGDDGIGNAVLDALRKCLK